MEKQRKFLMVLPLLIIPFLTMAFWALGGGETTAKVVYTKGLNTDLPQFKDDKQQKDDKLSVYQHTVKDSTGNGVSPEFLKSMGLDKAAPKNADTVASADGQAQLIQKKLNKLNRQLSQPEQPQVAATYDEPDPENVRQLNKMMHHMSTTKQAPDPEMQQLNKMLDKIQAIQNPNSVTPKTSSSAKEKAKPFRAIAAFIDGKQKVADGAAVKLKLADTATIKGQLLPKGQEIFGSCQIINQRLLLNIENIRLEKQIIPVSLTVFSLDGMQGIPAPEAELAGSASVGADNTLQSMQLITMDQSLGAQAAAGGVNAAKGLFSKKVKKVKVKLKDQFQVLLRINR